MGAFMFIDDPENAQDATLKSSISSANLKNHGAKVDIYPINTYITFMKRQGLTPKCFALKSH